MSKGQKVILAYILNLDLVNLVLYQGFHPGGKAFISPSAAKGSNCGSESGSIPIFVA